MANIKTYILTLLVTLLGSLSAMADNVVSITGFDIVAGETKELAINLANTDPVSTLEIELTLPKGIKVKEIEGDKFAKVNRAIRHSIAYAEKVKDEKESYLIFLTSTSLREMAAGDAPIITFEVTADKDFNPISFISIDRVEGGNKTTVELINQEREIVYNEKAHFVLSATESISGMAGDIIPVTVSLENKVQVSQMSAKIVLPEGLEIVPDEEGYLYSPTTRTSNFEVDGVKLNDIDYTVLITTISKIVFKGSEGAIFTFNVKASKAIENANIIIKDVVCSDQAANSIKVEGLEIPVKINVFGDVNYDGEVNIGDYTTVANYILAGENPVEADLNNDDNVDVGDLTAIANLILYGEQDAAQAKPRNATDPTAFDNVIYMKDATAKAGDEIEIPVYMKNSVAMTGFQFDVVMPEGLSVAMEDECYLIDLSTERTTARKTNTFDSAEQKDGSVRVLAGSTKSETFSGTDGEVAIITANVAEGLADGEYKVVLKNIIMSDKTGQTYKVDSSEATITIDTATGITAVKANSLDNGKYLKDGKFVIVKNGKNYSAAGAQMK